MRRPVRHAERGLSMKIDGSCYCGRVTFVAEIDPAKVAICHCTDCQTLSGSAFRTLAFAREGTFALLSGIPKIYVRTGEGGSQRRLYFCADCGTPICSSAVADDPKVYAIRVGTIRQRAELRPGSQIWFRSAQPWVGEIASIPAFQTDAPSDAESEGG
jgi:hypothetical protein